MATTNLGRVRFRYRGEHSAETEYIHFDWVTDSGNSYAYINATPSTGTALSNTDYWVCFAEKGDQGIQGIQGIQGVQGDPGDISNIKVDGQTKTKTAGTVDLTSDFARYALWRKTGNPVSIYPVPESNLDYTIKLQATQSGAGDPSPENVRSIIMPVASGGELKLKATAGDDENTFNEITITNAIGRDWGGVPGYLDELNVVNGQLILTKKTEKIILTRAVLGNGGYTIIDEGGYVTCICFGQDGKINPDRSSLTNVFKRVFAAGSQFFACRLVGGSGQIRLTAPGSVMGVTVDDTSAQMTLKFGNWLESLDPLPELVYVKSTVEHVDLGPAPILNSVTQLNAITPRENIVTASVGQLEIGFAKSLNKESSELEQLKFKPENYITTTVTPPFWGLKAVYLNGDTKGMNKDTAKPMTYKLWDDRTGSCSVKWQGSSSIAYPKKNYNITFDSDLEIVEEWGAHSKYCLKANYIDFSHARNNVCAKLWNDVVKSRDVVPDWVAAAPNSGAIDGFPCMLFINDEYYGLMSFNIPKDKWMFGMTGPGPQAILSAEGTAMITNPLANWGTTGYKIEHSAGMTEQQVKDSISLAKQKLSEVSVRWDYIDLPSVIDFNIFLRLTTAYDLLVKNHLLATFDGVKWYYSVYDLDSTFGGSALGDRYSNIAVNFAPSLPVLNDYLIPSRQSDVKNRYAELRSGALSEENVYYRLYNYLADIPRALRNHETIIWPKIPGTDTSTPEQIMQNYRLRCKLMDSWVDSL